MTEEIKQEVAPIELTPIQEEALSQGWVPKEEFDGDPEKFVDAAEFLRRGELFQKIESQSKEMKQLKKAMAELARHNAKIREVEYDRAVQSLKAEKKQALAEGDADKVVEIDDRIDLVKDQQKQFTQQQINETSIPQETHPELANWISKNSWYESDKKMRAYADTLGVQLANEGLTPREVLKEVEKEVKERFKEKFRNPNRERAGAVEGVTTRPARSSAAEYELTDTERTVMNTLVSQGVLTKEKYIEQLKAIKEKH